MRSVNLHMSNLLLLPLNYFMRTMCFSSAAARTVWHVVNLPVKMENLQRKTTALWKSPKILILSKLINLRFIWASSVCVAVPVKTENRRWQCTSQQKYSAHCTINYWGRIFHVFIPFVWFTFSVMCDIFSVPGFSFVNSNICSLQQINCCKG